MSSSRDDQFIERYVECQSGLYRFIATLVPNRADAEELFQEVSLTAWKIRDRFDLVRSFLLACGSIHARLSWEYGPTLADKPLAQFSRTEDEECRLRPNRSNQEASGFHWLARLSQRRPTFVRLGWAFAVLALGQGVFLVPRLRPARPEPLAVITRCLGAQTADSRGAIRPGQRLGPGRLSLEAGTVEVTIQNGARILLEGPATLELLTPMRAYLQAGRAVVHVPEAARGFVLETRDANVLDVGTEFGVKVGPDPGTEVQVYQGSVFTTPKLPGGHTSSPQRLFSGSAAREPTALGSSWGRAVYR